MPSIAAQSLQPPSSIAPAVVPSMVSVAPDGSSPYFPRQPEIGSLPQQHALEKASFQPPAPSGTHSRNECPLAVIAAHRECHQQLVPVLTVVVLGELLSAGT